MCPPDIEQCNIFGISCHYMNMKDELDLLVYVLSVCTNFVSTLDLCRGFVAVCQKIYFI